MRSAYRSPAVNGFGNENGLNCSSNEANHARHIWDMPDKNGNRGAMACVVVNGYVDFYESTKNWQALAWWIHDRLPYSELVFFPKLAAFNVSWNEVPARTIYSYVPPAKGYLTRPGMDNHDGSHENEYRCLDGL